MSVYDEVISHIMVELNTEQAEYQKLYSKLYGETDMRAKQTYALMIDLCKRIRMEILLKGSDEERGCNKSPEKTF